MPYYIFIDSGGVSSEFIQRFLSMPLHVIVLVILFVVWSVGFISGLACGGVDADFGPIREISFDAPVHFVIPTFNLGRKLGRWLFTSWGGP
jgi:hypothetical protein